METTVTMKRCSRCKQEKPRTEFGEDRRAKDRLRSECRECKRAYDREYKRKNAARNPDEIPVPAEKKCPKCGITRPLSEWSRSQVSPDGLQGYCKLCQSAESAK